MTRYRHLPPGIGYYPTADHGVFGGYHFHLLPFLEQGNLYDRSLGSVPFPGGPITVHYPGNNNVYSQPVPTFLCPSDPSVESGGVVTINLVLFGASCYAPNALVTARADFTQTPPVPNPQGKARIPNDFADGTSHTILHAEKYARCTNTDMAPAFQDGGTAWAYTTSPLFPWQPPPMIPPGKAFQPGFAIAALVARGAPNAIGPGSIFQVQPSRAIAIRRGPRRRTPAGWWLAWPTAASALLAAGMSGDVWWAAVTPAGEEVQDSDW